jgi:hypothetical protein
VALSKCGIIATRQEDIIGNRDDGYFAECILERHGWGPHVFRTPEGKIYAWEDDMECGCCEPDEDDRCTIYWEISETDLPKYQNETA